MILLVEGDDIARQIVRGIAQRVAPSSDGLRIDTLKGSLDPRRSMAKVQTYASTHRQSIIVVYDQDGGTIADHPDQTPDAINISWCPAIPQIEAWLFADDLALKEIAPSESAETIQRIPSPENIPYPKMLRHYWLRAEGSLDRIIRTFDLERAGSRSPSLANFCRTLQISLNLPPTFDSAVIGSRQFDRDIVKGLINEVYPSKQTIFRTSSGELVTASQMLNEVTVGSQLGREYSTAILRVARDFLKRQAEREKKSRAE